jgi:hypothetical protein
MMEDTYASLGGDGIEAVRGLNVRGYALMVGVLSKQLLLAQALLYGVAEVPHTHLLWLDLDPGAHSLSMGLFSFLSTFSLMSQPWLQKRLLRSSSSSSPLSLGSSPLPKIRSRVLVLKSLVSLVNLAHPYTNSQSKKSFARNLAKL